MSWGRIDDDFWHHPKVVRLEDEFGPQVFAQAICVWTLTLSYCRKFDPKGGRVKLTKLRRLVPFSPVRASKALVQVGLWTGTSGSFTFHDWADFGPKPANKSTKNSPNKSATSSEQVTQQVGNKSPNKSIVRPAESLTKSHTPEPVPDPVPVEQKQEPFSPSSEDSPEVARRRFIAAMPVRLHGTYGKQRKASGIRVALPKGEMGYAQLDPLWERIASAIWDQTLASQEPWEIVAQRVYQRFFVDQFARQHGYKPKTILSNFALYANPEAVAS